jgi:hypothetical protein
MASESTDRSIRAVAAAFALAILAGCTPPPTDQALWARCVRYDALWVRYEYPQSFFHIAAKIRADHALYECQRGHYHPALEDLEDILRRVKIPVPEQ